MSPPNGALWGIPFLLFVVLKLVAVGGGVEGMKLCRVFSWPWLLLENESSSESEWKAKARFFFFFWSLDDVPAICKTPHMQEHYYHNRSRITTSQLHILGLVEWGIGQFQMRITLHIPKMRFCLMGLGKGSTLQPREQNLKESRRLLSQTSQVLRTPFPGLGWGRSLMNTTLALLIT